MKYTLVLLISILSTACVPQYAIQKSLLTVYNAANVSSAKTSTENCKFSFVEGDIEAMELADKISDKFKDNPSEFESKYRKYICGR